MEDKLKSYNGYIPKSFSRWRSQVKLADPSIAKIIGNLEIINSREVREVLRRAVSKYAGIFKAKNSYICKFGDVGKSGEILIYEFRHTFKEHASKLIETWQIPSLPEKSKIIFLDDLIGTGRQSVRHIVDKLYKIISPSHEAFLFTLCSTPQGMTHVENNTNFKVIAGRILSEDRFQYLHDKCNVFDSSEKDYLKTLRVSLSSSASDYDLGLLLAFWFTVPNNTMPFIWNNGYGYSDNGVQKKWLALLPREY